MVQSNIGIGWRHPHYQELLERKSQPDDPLLNSAKLDFLEVHSENFFGAGGAALAVLREGRAHYPISLHGVGLALGSAAGLDRWHLDQLAALVAHIDPIRVSDHACFARGNYNNQAIHAADLLPIPFSHEALNVMCTNVQQVQDRLKRRIAVENLSAYVTCEGSEMPETAFLNALAQRTGCQLLIDVNNIYVNALNDQIYSQINNLSNDPLTQCMAWIDAIHPSRVAEIHLAGHIDCGDIVIDDHGSRVKPPVWALYQHTLRRFGNTPTLIEWDTDIPALDVLLAEAATARSYAV
ncbi:MAG: hypothetical protein RL171_385 [Pseudomonadota bacterium]|jgi:uncharacterized protein (UPF0276 family)